MSTAWADDDLPPPDDDDAPPDVVVPIKRRRTRAASPPVSEFSEFTDSAASERLVAEALSGRWLFTTALGWLRWTGSVWDPTPDAALIEVVRGWVNGEVVRVARDSVAARTRAATDLQSAGRIKRLAELARGQVLADAAEFDQDADMLVCTNGVIDLRTGEIVPHDPGRLVTRQTGHRYRPGFTHPDWTAAQGALPAEALDWTQLRFGQAATGHQPDDDKMITLKGGGENGKSTLLVGVKRALGAYAVLVPDQLLTASSESHPADLMTLRGARLALIEETPDQGRLNVARLKKILGTPEISARLMRQNFTTFRATHALVLSTNYKLIVAESDHGTWRRLALLTCPFRFVKPGVGLQGPHDRHGDPGLKPRIESGTPQAEAALAWLVDGAIRWYQGGRVMPPLPACVERDTQEWREGSDSILAYAIERLEPDPKSRIWTTDLLADFNRVLLGLGQREWSDRTLAERFGGHSWAGDHRIEKSRGRHPDTVISRPNPLGPGGIPDVHHAWVGVRFKTL